MSQVHQLQLGTLVSPCMMLGAWVPEIPTLPSNSTGGEGGGILDNVDGTLFWGHLQGLMISHAAVKVFQGGCKMFGHHSSIN